MYGLVSMLPGRSPAQTLSTWAWPSTGQSRDCHVQQVAHGRRGGTDVEARVLLGRTNQYVSISARDQIVLAVLDDPREQGSVMPQEHDLAFQGRGGGVHADLAEQPTRPGPRGHDDPSTRKHTLARPDPGNPVAAGVQPIDGQPGPQPDATLVGGGGQGAQVPGISDLGTIRQEIDQPQLRVQGRLDAESIAGGKAFMDDALDTPAPGRGLELMLLGLRACDIDPAVTAIAVVDARLLAQRCRPLWEELGAPRPQLHGGMKRAGAALAGRGDQPGAGPRGFAAQLASIQDRAGDAVPRQGIGDGEPDDTSADNDDILYFRHAHISR